MKKYGLFAISVSVLLVLCLPVYSLGYTGPNVVRASIYGVAIGDQGTTATYHDVDVNMSDTDHFAVRSPVDDVGTRLRIRIYVDTDSITQFHLRISTGSAGPQVSQALQQSATWSYIYSYNPSTDSFSGGTSIADKCTLTQTADPSIWDFYYVGDSAISGNCIQVTLFTASHNYVGNKWFHFSIDRFTVNGQVASELGPTETLQSLEEHVKENQLAEDAWFNEIYIPGQDSYQIFTNVAAVSQSEWPVYYLANNAPIIAPMIIFVFAMAVLGYLLFGRRA